MDFGEHAGRFVACVAVPADHAGKQIVVRADRPDGPVIARLTVHSTGGWGKLEVQAALLSPIRGTHDLYLSFTGSGVANLYWMQFAPPGAPTEPLQAGASSQPSADVAGRLGGSGAGQAAVAPGRAATQSAP